MTTLRTHRSHVIPDKTSAPKGRPGERTLGIAAHDAPRVIRLVRAGFPFSRMARFQRATGLPWATVARFVAIAPRTLTRRQSEGKLQPDESDRLWRASAIFDMAMDLFDGDATAARQWLVTPQLGLGGAIPLEFASTEVGSREVEDLISRLEYGIVA
jgi:putative toxin-antitoxin system antitoxin component (TIGR02293 family)